MYYFFSLCYILDLLQKNRLQSQIKRKISVIPLTFDFQLELEKDIGTSMSKTNSKITTDRSYGTKKPKRLSL